MRRRKASIAIISALLALGALAGCVESDPEAAETPTGATTVQNSAAQTDSEGNTVSAPADTSAGGDQPLPEDEEAGDQEERAAGEDSPGAGGGGDATAGIQLFTSAGCGGCHTLEAAGTSGGVGPDLDETLQGKSPDQIMQDIVDPDAEIAEGYQAGVMPGTYESLSEQELNDLVAALTQ